MNTDRRLTDLVLHRDLETMGLTPEEYRLYGHLVATIQSPAPDPASACHLTPEASKLALAVLSGCGLIASVEGVWVLCDRQDWAHGMVEQVRESAKKELAKAQEPETPHQEFMRRWDEEFFKVNGFKYTFDGGRDGKSVKALLAQGKTVSGMIEIAVAAWTKSKSGQGRCWACAQAATLAGFHQRLNAIQLELRQGCNGSAPPSLNGSVVYGEKLEVRKL